MSFEAFNNEMQTKYSNERLNWKTFYDMTFAELEEEINRRKSIIAGSRGFCRQWQSLPALGYAIKWMQLHRRDETIGDEFCDDNDAPT